MGLENTKFDESDLSHEALIPVCINVINRTLLFCRDSTTSPFAVLDGILKRIVGNRNPKLTQADANIIFNSVIDWASDSMLNWSSEESDSDEYPDENIEEKQE